MVREVEIRWTKEYEFNQLKKREHFLSTHFGLYMFLEAGFRKQRPKQYRGKDKELIYIGIVKSNARDFRVRMDEHRSEWLSNISRGQIFVKFGILYATFNITDELIEDVESALVFDNQPSENEKKKKSYTIAQDLIVKNINHQYLLHATVDTRAHTA